MASQLKGRELRDFWTLSVGQLLLFCGFFSFFQFPLYIKSVGGGEVAIGVIMGVTALASTLLLPWITAIVERVERRQLMLIGMVLLELGTIACMTTWAPDLYMASLMVVRGLGFTLYMNASGTYIAQILPPAEKARWLSINFGFNQVAIGVGPSLGELLITKVNYPFFFFFSTALVYAGMLLVLAVTRREPVHPGTPFRARPALDAFTREVVGVRFRKAFLTLLMLAGALGAVFNFTATFAKLMGFSSGLFFSVYAAANAASRFGGAGLADRYGRAFVILPTLLMLAGGIFLFSTVDGPDTSRMVLAAILIGIGFGLSNPALLAQMLDRSPPRLQGMAIGGFHFAYQLGLLSSAPLYGVVAEHWGYPPMWWIAGGLSLAAIGVFLLPESPVPPEPEAAEEKTEAGLAEG